MKKNFIGLTICFVSLLFLTACFGTKKITVGGKKIKMPTPNLLESQVAANALDVSEMEAKLKVRAGSEKSMQSFTADLRLKKDEKIWISVYPPIIRLEVARALITPDSIKLIDRFNKKYYAEPLSYIENVSGYAFRFQDLQGIILGQSMISSNETSTVDYKDETFYLNTLLETIQSKTTIAAKDYTVQEVALQDSSINASIKAYYSNYQTVKDKPFAMQRDVEIKTPDVYKANITISKLKTEGPLKYGFKVSPKYKRARW